MPQALLADTPQSFGSKIHARRVTTARSKSSVRHKTRPALVVTSQPSTRVFNTNGSGPQTCTALFDATHSSGNGRGAVPLLRSDSPDKSTLNPHREPASTSKIKEPASAAGQTFAI